MSYYDEKRIEEEQMKRAYKIFSLLLCMLMLFCSVTKAEVSATDTASEDVRVASRFWELLFKEKKNGKEQTEKTRPTLIASGDLFGLRLKTDGVIVVSVDRPEYGILCEGDILLSLDGEKLNCAEDLKAKLDGKDEVELTLLRRGKTEHKKHPVENNTLGITVRDSALGIGTVTYINPDTGAFGGLGHGITEGTSGALIPIIGGDVTDVTLGGVTKGAEGKPGELCGVLRHNDKGDIQINDSCGVFGILDTPTSATPIPIAYRGEVREGDATVLCTVRQGKTLSYNIKIRDIDFSSTTNKCFLVEVTDPALLAITGGIVRGMSGSPIIQDGKLVGAVTHVLINDPSVGYGIFIENMLNAAENTVPKAA